MPDERTEHATQAETGSRAEQSQSPNENQRTHLQRQRPAAPAHPAPGEGALVVVEGVGARRVAAVVVRAAAVPVAVAGGRVEAAEQEVGQRRRHRHGSTYTTGALARVAQGWGEEAYGGELPLSAGSPLVSQGGFGCPAAPCTALSLLASSGWVGVGVGVGRSSSRVPLASATAAAFILSPPLPRARPTLCFFFFLPPSYWCLNSGRLGRKKRGPALVTWYGESQGSRAAAGQSAGTHVLPRQPWTS